MPVFPAILLTAVLSSIGLVWGIGRWLTAAAESNYPPEGEFIQIDGCRYHYRRVGAGLPVVLLHGTGASLDDYHPGVFRSLAAEVQIVAIDRPGHGHSGRPTAACGTPLEQARIVRRILVGLGIDRAILVGHSWAGALVLAYALEYPTATLGVVLVEGTVYPQAVVTNLAIKALALPWIGFWAAHLVTPWAGRGAIQNVLERAFAPNSVPPDYLARARAMWTRPEQARAIAIDARRRDATIAALSSRYSEIVAPVWMVVGMADQFIDPAGQLLRLQKVLPDAKLTLLDRAGHQIPQNHPQAVVDAVLGLAATLSADVAMGAR